MKTKFQCRKAAVGLAVASILSSGLAMASNNQSIDNKVAQYQVIKQHQSQGSGQYLNLIEQQNKAELLSLLKEHGYSEANSPALFGEIEKAAQAQLIALSESGDWSAAFKPIESTFSASQSKPILAPLQLNKEFISSYRSVAPEKSDGALSFSSEVGSLSSNSAVYSGVDSAIPETALKQVERILILSAFYDNKGKRIGTSSLFDSFDTNEVRLRAAVDAQYIIKNIQPHESVTLKTTRMVVYKNGASGLVNFASNNTVMERLEAPMTGAMVRNFAESGGSNFDVEIFEPKRKRPVVDNQTHVRVCINRGDVLGKSGCDIPKNNNFDLTFPINGFVKLKGNYSLAQDDAPENSSIPGKTDIVLWRKAGTSENIETGSLQSRPNEPANNFKQYIARKYEVVNGQEFTTFSFNIPREKAYFGRATLYEGSGRFPHENQDKKLNWSVNMSTVRDYSSDPMACEMIKMANGTDTCLSNELLSLSTQEKDSANFTWNGLPQLSFVYGCLAKGSLVMNSQGQWLPIEEIKMGEIVKANGMNMKVVSLTNGVEKHMTRIETEDGEELLLTQTHPIFTQNRGIIWASEVREGDEVITTDGPATVDEVETELYNDEVYNLKVEPLEEHAHLASDKNQAFFANGLLVGDAVLQNKLATKNVKKKRILSKEEALKVIPEKWHKDYEFLVKKHTQQPAKI